MTESLSPGTRLLFMKVGTHAQEELSDIIRRKQAEIEAEGMAMWGYGGNTCHPTSMVQPFLGESPEPVMLCMQPMLSKHFADPLRAEQYSADGLNWVRVPSGINVLGSRYALCLGSLDEVDEEVDLGATRVSIGKSQGRAGSTYLSGRVDKACLTVTDAPVGDPRVVPIKLKAEIIRPYAVFLKG